MVGGEIKLHAEPERARPEGKDIVGESDVGKPVTTLLQMADCGEKGEKIFFFSREEMGNGAALGADYRKISLGGPEETFEQALAVQELAGFDFEDPAGDAVDDLFAPGLGLVEPQAVFGEQEGLDFPDIPEIFGG